MIVGLNSLVNQYVPSFLINNLTDGQTLEYDSTQRAFVNVTPAGGPTTPSLGELINVSPTVDGGLGGPTNGQALVYNSVTALWQNSFVDYNTLLNQPTNSSYSFSGLSDTTKPPLPNGYVLWNSAATQLVYSTTIPVSSITGLAPVATAGTLGSLSNVASSTNNLNDTTDVGKDLVWSGTQWVASNAASADVTNLVTSLGNGVNSDGSFNVTGFNNVTGVLVDPTDYTNAINQIAASMTGTLMVVKNLVPLNQNGTISIGVPLPSGATILSIKVNVSSTDSSAQLSIGNASNPSLYMSTSQNNPQSQGIYVVETFVILSSSTQIYATVTTSSNTGAGSCNAIVTYQL